MKYAIFLLLLPTSLACSKKADVPPDRPASEAQPCVPAKETPPPVPATVVSAAPSGTAADPPPAGSQGLAWRTCSPGTGPVLCSNTEFRKVPLGMLEDNSSDPDINKRYIYSTQARCQGGFCRADLNNGHQCQNDDKVACTLFDAVQVSGLATCVNGSWRDCVVGALKVSTTSQVESPGK
jgi:hypothetical protein